jgi:hypothetical protein
MKQLLFILGFSISLSAVSQTEVINTLEDTKGKPVTISFEKGEYHNHPLMVFWLQDADGNYLQTLYVAESIGTSVYKFGKADKGVWKKGTHRRPAALPYWAHNRGVMAKDSLYIPHPDNPMPDAVTGATPKNDFILETVIPKNVETPFYILMEINQPWDWNEYWKNARFPQDKEYKTSAQPAVVYRAEITDLSPQTVEMELVGRSHHSGENGLLHKDLETITTAKQIADKVKVTVK